MHALSTLELDETSIEGTSAILSELLKQAGLSPDQVNGRGFVHAGDLGTLMKVEGLKKLRVRDFAENRLNYLVRMDGMFHTEMAAEDLLFRVHWGREEGLAMSFKIRAGGQGYQFLNAGIQCLQEIHTDCRGRICTSGVMYTPRGMLNEF